ncbi:unnamed protein product [Polarella glacialis]|uniref:Endonuclease/exonuclease/phosphatase domain-containing protein n=1 Tax=Polarella glacialis TaxID=89957 RepID=A0A813EVM7_POLGL|nr:unnamed protein product [Polarella glacialis]
MAVTFNVTDDKIGTDAIASAIIYQPKLVSVVGRAILDSSVDPMFRSISRPTLAVTFKEVSSGNEFTVVINHLKSKGSSCVSCCADPDSTFVGNCNGVRINATKAIGKWLKPHPTGSTTDDVLIIGDLNSYHYETPIQTLITEFGYVDMIDKFTSKETSSSYVYAGLAGYLDHALASSTLMRNITMVMAWKINADENRALDYNTEYKSASQVTSLYNDGPFRSGPRPHNHWPVHASGTSCHNDGARIRHCHQSQGNHGLGRAKLQSVHTEDGRYWCSGRRHCQCDWCGCEEFGGGPDMLSPPDFRGSFRPSPRGGEWCVRDHRPRR